MPDHRLNDNPTNGKQHAHLLREFYGIIDGGTPEQQDSPTTLLSRQFDGAQSLFEVSARLADGKELLRDALSTITNEHATTKMTNITIIIIQKSVLPLCIRCVTDVFKCGWSDCLRKLCSQKRGSQ